MLLFLLMTLCYSVSSFDLEKSINDLEDGNLVKGLLEGFKKIKTNGEEIVENLERFEKNLELSGLNEKNPLADFDLGRIADVSSRTKRKAVVPHSAPIYRFCQRIDLDCCCNDCGESDCDSDLPESFDWSQHITMPPPPARATNSSDDDAVAATVIANYVEIMYRLRQGQTIQPLAAQQLTDCAEYWEKYLSWAGAVTRLVIQGGFELDEDYQATTSDSECRFDEDKIAVQVDLCYQLNVEHENCLKRVLVKSGPLLVGLRKANWDFDYYGVLSCDAVLDTYTPYILVGYGVDFEDVWYLVNLQGKVFQIDRGMACQDIGMYTLTIDVY